jgi:hypothetical protein
VIRSPSSVMSSQPNACSVDGLVVYEPCRPGVRDGDGGLLERGAAGLRDPAGAGRGAVVGGEVMPVAEDRVDLAVSVRVDVVGQLGELVAVGAPAAGAVAVVAPRVVPADHLDRLGVDQPGLEPGLLLGAEHRLRRVLGVGLRVPVRADVELDEPDPADHPGLVAAAAVRRRERIGRVDLAVGRRDHVAGGGGRVGGVAAPVVVVPQVRSWGSWRASAPSRLSRATSGAARTPGRSWCRSPSPGNSCRPCGSAATPGRRVPVRARIAANVESLGTLNWQDPNATAKFATPDGNVFTSPRPPASSTPSASTP